MTVKNGRYTHTILPDIFFFFPPPGTSASFPFGFSHPVLSILNTMLFNSLFYCIYFISGKHTHVTDTPPDHTTPTPVTPLCVVTAYHRFSCWLWRSSCCSWETSSPRWRWSIKRYKRTKRRLRSGKETKTMLPEGRLRVGCHGSIITTEPACERRASAWVSILRLLLGVSPSSVRLLGDGRFRDFTRRSNISIVVSINVYTRACCWRRDQWCTKEPGRKKGSQMCY